MSKKIEIERVRRILFLLLTTDYSNHHIARMLGVAPNSVRYYRKKLLASGLTEERIDELNDHQLEKVFRSKSGRNQAKVMPKWAEIHDQLARNRYLTLEAIHEEYKAIFKEKAYCYSQFTHYFREYEEKLDVSMRLRHYPGEAMQVDYCGSTIPWTDSKTGEIRQAQVFVACLGYSSYTFAWASRSQSLGDFIEAHIRAFGYFKGVPVIIVPDNLKSAVTQPGLDIVLNRSYQAMAQHYGPEIIPARVRKPQDKGKAGQAVLMVSRWIITALRNHNFFSVADINEAITELLPKLNGRPLRNYPGTRQSRYEEHDLPALKPLPEKPFEFSEWVTKQKVAKDYHIKIHKHFYSVPFYLVGEYVEARVSQHLVEIFHLNKRVASHVRSHEEGGFTVDNNHMPPQRLAYANQNLEGFVKWAKDYGRATESVIRAQYDGQSEHSMIAARACSKLQKLARTEDLLDFEAACQRAIDIASPTAKSIQSILRTGLFRLNRTDLEHQVPLPIHENVRGASYYTDRGL